MLAILLICFSVAVAAPGAEYSGRKRYDNYRLLSVKAQSENQLNILAEIMNEGLDNEFFDFWSEPSMAGPAEFTVSPASYQKVNQFLTSRNLTVNIAVPDIQRLIDVAEQEVTPKVTLPFNARMVHTAYHRYGQLSDYLTGFANSYVSIARKRSMTYATSDRLYIDYLEISTNGFANTRPVIFIEAGIHAREWITPASVMYSIDKMLAGYGIDSSITQMLDRFDWIIVPVSNPDGYEYSHTNDRMWRKNRAPHSIFSCRGVDLNRNFDARWGTTGVSSNCYSDTYPGSSIMSEIESKNIETLLNEITGARRTIVGYLAVHSYSQLFLLPYAHTSNGPRPPNSATLDRYGQLAVSALENVNGKSFRIGTAPDLLYAASGSSADWAMMAGYARYAYTYELRPASANEGGFSIPASNIVPSGEELFASFQSLANSFGGEF